MGFNFPALPSDRFSASAAGIPRFYSGEPCRKGHISTRFSCDGKCTECVRLEKQAYYAANKEQMLAADSRRYAANPEAAKKRSSEYREKNKNLVRVRDAEYRVTHQDSIKTRFAVWYAANGDKARSQQAAYRRQNAAAKKLRDQLYYLANREKLLGQSAALRSANPEKYRQYRILNAENMRAQNARRRALKRAAGAEHITLDDIIERDGLNCYICGCLCDPRAARRASNKAELEHVVPLSKGGTHTAGNLRLACHPCNRIKGNRLTPEQTAEAARARRVLLACFGEPAHAGSPHETPR